MTTFDTPRAAEQARIARPPTRLEKVLDRVLRVGLRCSGWLLTFGVCAVVMQIAARATPAVRVRGGAFIVGKVWDPNTDRFAILPEIWGTLYTSTLALIVGSAFGLGAAVFLSEGFLGHGIYRTLALFRCQHRGFLQNFPDRADDLLRHMIELLAAIPSVVYGLWGIYVVIPAIRPGCVWLAEHMGWFPLFATPFRGPGVLPATIVLAVMILPTVTALSCDVLRAVPNKLRAAAYGLGATRWETILTVLLPTARRGLFAAIVLAFGRALGETMALAMLVGNANRISLSLFSPASTLAALLANNFPEAGPNETPLLMYAALVLLAITLLVNMLGAALLARASHARTLAGV